MAAPFRAVAPLLAGFALAACGGKPGPEDPAVAVSTGIPMGALSAGGVSLDSPVDHGEVSPLFGGKIDTPPKPLPLNPFDPAPTPAPTPPPRMNAPKKKGTSL